MPLFVDALGFLLCHAVISFVKSYLRLLKPRAPFNGFTQFSFDAVPAAVRMAPSGATKTHAVACCIANVVTGTLKVLFRESEPSRIASRF